MGPMTEVRDSVRWRKRPGWVRRRIGDPLARLLIGRFGGARAAVLRTRRSDGTRRRVPLFLWRRADDRYLVALFGETFWVRDIRAGRAAELEGRGGARAVHLRELPRGDAAEFLGYFSETFATPAKQYLGVSGPLSRAEREALAVRHAVFTVLEVAHAEPTAAA